MLILPKTVGVASLRRDVWQDFEELGGVDCTISKGNVFQAEGTASIKIRVFEHNNESTSSAARVNQGEKRVGIGKAGVDFPGLCGSL